MRHVRIVARQPPLVGASMTTTMPQHRASASWREGERFLLSPDETVEWTLSAEQRWTAWSRAGDARHRQTSPCHDERIDGYAYPLAVRAASSRGSLRDRKSSKIAT